MAGGPGWGREFKETDLNGRMTARHVSKGRPWGIKADQKLTKVPLHPRGEKANFRKLNA